MTVVAWRNWGNARQRLSGYTAFWRRIEPWTSKVRSAAVSTVTCSVFSLKRRQSFYFVYDNRLELVNDGLP